MAQTAILGFGNPVRSDDGVGCYVIERLRERLPAELLANISLLDMGTSAFEVLFQLQGHRQIIFVDAVINSGEEDGSLFQLPASEIDAAIQDDPMVFLHSLKWDQALSYARKILGDDYPDDIGVYLIAVTDTRLEVGMSPVVQRAGDRLVDLLLERMTAAAPHSLTPASAPIPTP